MYNGLDQPVSCSLLVLAVHMPATLSGEHRMPEYRPDLAGMDENDSVQILRLHSCVFPELPHVPSASNRMLFRFPPTELKVLIGVRHIVHGTIQNYMLE